MKKVLLVLLALPIAFLFTELLVSNILHYPKYGVDRKLLGIRSSEGGVENIYFPHSKYWTVEGGNRVFQRNNLGLPGTDVVVSGSSRYVFVLGCSFVEAEQIPPDSMATSIFQRRLSRIDPQFQVVNLAHSAHDLYDSYRRSAYYEQTFPPKAVFLEIHDDGAQWLPRHPHPLTFTLPPDFGKPKSSFPTEVLIFLRNRSSLVNMITIAYKYAEIREQDEVKGAESRRSTADDGREATLPMDFLTCLEEFHVKYKEKFCVISMIPDARENDALTYYCRSHGLKFLSKEILIPENQLSGGGHLNLAGNAALGDFLYESFVEVYGKP
jgi:hypothetical protein